MAVHAFKIQHEQDVYSVLSQVEAMVRRGLPAGAVEVVVGRPGKRTLSQNKKLWPMLSDISKQVEWPVNGVLEKLSTEEWKDVLTAALSSEQKVTQGVNGGFVMLGKSTSKMKKAEFADLIEVIYAFGSERQVRWSEPALKAYEEWRT